MGIYIKAICTTVNSHAIMPDFKRHINGLEKPQKTFQRQND